MAITTESYSPELLFSLTESLNLAIECVPTIEALQPPSDGLSLFDVKNELLLSYVQNLVFLILFKLRNHVSSDVEHSSDAYTSQDEIIENLVSLRLYLEKGVRPLESRLKYQLDKLILAASEADSTAPQASTNGEKTKKKPKRASASASEDASESASEPEDNAPISDLSHRPNLSAFTRPTKPSPSSKPTTTTTTNPKTPYKPPRITPTALPPPLPPTTNPSQSRKRKNHLLDAFVTEELSSAPPTEMSIGAGGGLRGREAERERERREYEEGRLVRLPDEGGGKRKKGRAEGRGKVGGWDEVIGGGGGEGLGEAVRGGGVGKGKRRRGEGGGEGVGRRVGAMWEERKRRGVKGMGGKKRR